MATNNDLIRELNDYRTEPASMRGLAVALGTSTDHVAHLLIGAAESGLVTQTYDQGAGIPWGYGLTREGFLVASTL